MTMPLKGVLSFLHSAVACGALATAFLAGASASTPTAQAQTISFNIPAGSLQSALSAFASQSGLQLIYAPEAVVGRQVAALRGDLSPRAALQQLIADSDLRIRQINAKVIVLEWNILRAGPNRSVSLIPSASDALPEPAFSGSQQSRGTTISNAPGEDMEIVVTGSRIRGAPVASPTITKTQDQMRNEGYANLGDVVRSIPQTFGGGQNPGVGANVPAANGVNVGSASTINLRGLGSDATLTLLNGHRLAYNGTRQGIDVSSIPIAMVDRIEIVADGASALYGSDAVAGVANIILKRDYDGLEARADLGGSTDGGNFQQQYGALTGGKWHSGGIILAYEFARNTDIMSDDRDYASTRRGVTLLPALRRHAVALAGHQALTDSLELTIDALFNKRWSRSVFPMNPDGNLDISRTEQNSTSRSFALAPTFRLDVGGGWRLSLSGSYGREDVRVHSDSYAGASQISSAFVCYCNKGSSVEFAGDGPLFQLPGGPAKFAFGAGYRYNLLDAFRSEGDVNNVRASQHSYYGYGEVSLPLISPELAVPAVRSLSLSGALRYERYPGIDSVATPKFGLIYSPIESVALKASWGKSFRAPTLFQQYQVRSALLYPAASLGGMGYPAGATALLLQGGNKDLTPERATTWTATIEVSPLAIPGLTMQLAYFSTRYVDRIVTPINFQSQALSNPLFQDRVAFAPGTDAITGAIADAAQFFNVSGLPFDPSTVVAIVDNMNVNAGRQKIHGIDFLANYQTSLGENAGDLTFSLNISYLESDQQLTQAAPILRRAGTLFNPPNWRGRGSATWKGGPLTVNAAANYIGGVDDTRFDPVVHVDPMTVFDFTIRYAVPATKGILRGLDLRLSLLNAFDDKPDRIATTIYSDTAYDSTNYSAIGRFIGFGISKAW